MPELINPVPAEEAQGWVAALATAMLNSPYDGDFPRRVDRWARDWYPDRTWGWRDNGRWVATLATETRTLTVPGPAGTTRDVDADAVTAVSVAGTHHRQGLMRSMLTRSLQAAKDRGDALSILIAAEWPIYGRFGYAPAAMGADYTFHSRRRFAGLPAPAPGSVRQVEPDELTVIARSLFDTARRQRPGQVDRREPWWDRRLLQDGYEPIGKRPHWVLHEGPDGPDGIVAWKSDRDFTFDDFGSVKVEEFFCTSEQAYRDLWGYLAGLDLVDEIELTDRPVDEPVRWALGDGRSLAVRSIFDGLWLRVLDLPRALSSRCYATPGRLVLEVVDDDTGGYAAGRVVVEADEVSAQCEPTDAAPDLVLPQRALAACYLGGHRLAQLAGPTGIQEHTSGALNRADVMFSVPLAPLNQTMF